jgi:hypothetical protein
MDTQFSGDAPGRTGETQQKGRENPVGQWSLTPMQQGSGEVVEGALAAMAPVTFAPGAILVCTPLSNVVTLTSRALQRTIFPPQRMDIGMASFYTEQLVYMRKGQH